jgi:hypothetical protein
MPIMSADRRLIGLLLLIEQNDTEYDARYTLVYQALARATELGIPAGIAIDPNEPEWPVVYIALPTGQVSWHMPKWAEPYDGHTTPEKYDRIHAYARAHT